MKSFAVALLFLSPSLAFADLSVSVKRASEIQTIQPTIVRQIQTEDGTPFGAPVVTVGEPITKPPHPVVLLFLDSDRDLTDTDNVLVKPRCKTAQLIEVGTGIYVISTPGSHAVEINVLAQNPLAWDTVELIVTVGDLPAPDPDDPDPQPTPDVPTDNFNNLGQRVAAWSVALPKRDEVGAIYRDSANLLMVDQSQTINSVGVILTKRLNAIPEYASYDEMTKNVQADLTQRWSIRPMGRVEFAAYYQAIAAGLGVQ